LLTVGPEKTVVAQTNVAIPRGYGSHRSTRIPGAIATADAPNTAERNLQTKMVSRFCATATGMFIMQKQKKPINSGRERPYSSEIGPKINGPNIISSANNV
jgi:hypothetical protein